MDGNHVVLESICQAIFAGFPQVRAPDGSSQPNQQPKGIGLRALNPIGFINPGILETVKPRKTQNLQDSKIRPGDIVVAVRGSLPKAAIAEPSAEGLFISSNLSLIRPYPDIDPYFLLGWLEYKLEYISQRRASTGQINITLSQLRNLEVKMPPASERREIGEEYRGILELRKHHEELRGVYQTLSATYLNKAFGNSIL